MENRDKARNTMKAVVIVIFLLIGFGLLPFQPVVASIYLVGGVILAWG